MFFKSISETPTIEELIQDLESLKADLEKTVEEVQGLLEGPQDEDTKFKVVELLKSRTTKIIDLSKGFETFINKGELETVTIDQLDSSINAANGCNDSFEKTAQILDQFEIFDVQKLNAWKKAVESMNKFNDIFEKFVKLVNESTKQEIPLAVLRKTQEAFKNNIL